MWKKKKKKSKEREFRGWGVLDECYGPLRFLSFERSLCALISKLKHSPMQIPKAATSQGGQWQLLRGGASSLVCASMLVWAFGEAAAFESSVFP